MMYRKLRRFILCCRYLVGKRSCERGILICINMHNLIRCKTVRSESLNRKIVLSFLAAWKQFLVESCEMWKWDTVHMWMVALWDECPGRGLGMGWQGESLPCVVPAFSSQSSGILSGSFGGHSDVGVTHGPNSAFQQLCSRVKQQEQGRVRNPRTNCTPFCLGAGIIFILLEIQIHSHLDLPWAWCSSKINGNLHCRPLHGETLLVFKFADLESCESESPTQALSHLWEDWGGTCPGQSLG